MKRLAMAVAVAGLAFPAAAAAHLPSPDSEKIIPGVGMGEVKLDMTKPQVVGKWGPASECLGAAACYWRLPHNPARGEVASVSFQRGRVNLISIQAGRKSNGAFKPGFLSHWSTRPGHVHLGSPKGKVKDVFDRGSDPGILWTNNSTGVGGFDYFLGVDKSTRGTGPNTTDTRFSTPQVGPTPNRLWGISVSWACPRPTGACAAVPADRGRLELP
jgi:hypothetical protein